MNFKQLLNIHSDNNNSSFLFIHYVFWNSAPRNKLLKTLQTETRYLNGIIINILYFSDHPQIFLHFDFQKKNTPPFYNVLFVILD